MCSECGKWVTSEDGSFFIQGRVEVDLYHGEADFKKVYPVDVSRSFPGGVIGAVIYPKPSILKHCNTLKEPQFEVPYEEIEPLVVPDVLVRAKKNPKKP